MYTINSNLATPIIIDCLCHSIELAAVNGIRRRGRYFAIGHILNLPGKRMSIRRITDADSILRHSIAKLMFNAINHNIFHIILFCSTICDRTIPQCNIVDMVGLSIST